MKWNAVQFICEAIVMQTKVKFERKRHREGTGGRILHLSHHSGSILFVIFLYCEFGSKSKSWTAFALINTSAGCWLSPSVAPAAPAAAPASCQGQCSLQDKTAGHRPTHSWGTQHIRYIYVCVSSFSFVMRKTCAHLLDAWAWLGWAAMTATPHEDVAPNVVQRTPLPSYF